MPRVGLVVPSSNVTMEAEVPALLRASAGSRSMSFHSSRMRMTEVSAEGLAAMNAQADRCVDELADAAVDVLAYACLVAITSQGLGAHRRVGRSLSDRAGRPLVTSAGALVDALHHLGARRIAVICPYARPLADQVVAYLEAEGLHVADAVALEVTDNLAVAALDPMDPLRHAGRLALDGVDAIVASACVQMPSLPSLCAIEEQFGIPTVSAAAATAWSLLRALDIPPRASAGGVLFSSHPN